MKLFSSWSTGLRPYLRRHSLGRLSKLSERVLKTTIVWLFPPTISDRTLAAALQQDVSLASLPEYMRSGSGVRFYFAPTESESKRNLLISNAPPGTVEALVDRADNGCEHVFDVLGSGPV